MIQIVIAPTPVTHYCYANGLLSAPHLYQVAQPGSAGHVHCSTYHHFLSRLYHRVYSCLGYECVEKRC